MPEGPLGMERPFDHEEPILGVLIETEANIPKATAESANGYMIDGERDPFFEIEDVSDRQLIPGLDRHQTIFVDDSVEVQDIMLFINNLKDVTGETIYPSDVYFSPTTKTSRPLTKSSTTPALRFKITSSRGTNSEFRESVKGNIINEYTEIQDYEFVDGENVGYVTMLGNIPFKIVKKWSSEILGPNNKKVTDIDTDVVILHL